MIFIYIYIYMNQDKMTLISLTTNVTSVNNVLTNVNFIIKFNVEFKDYQFTLVKTLLTGVIFVVKLISVKLISL
jgi:hypothetical protein